LPQAPGFFGAFENAAKIGLGFYLIDGSLALTWGLPYHILTFIPITLIGAYYFARAGLTLGEIGSASKSPDAE